MVNQLLRWTFFILSFFTTGVLPHMEAQTIIDHKRFTIENGLAERVVNTVIRDSFGFFYLTTNSHIQRFDGKNFERLNIQALTDKKISPSQITALGESPSGKIMLRTSATDRYYYINPGELNISYKELEDPLELLESNGKIYSIAKIDDYYDVSVFDEQSLQSSQHLFNTKNIPLNVVQTGIHLFSQYDDLSVIKHQKNTGLKIVLKGKLTQSKNTITLAANNAIYAWRDHQFVKLHDLPIQNMSCKYLKMDKVGNVIAAYGEFPRFSDKLFVITPTNELYSLDSIISTEDVFLDFYADDILNKSIFVGYSGLLVVNSLQDGSAFFSRRKMGNQTFGFIVSGVATDTDDNIVYLNEGRRLFQIKDGATQPQNILDNYYEQGELIRNGKLFYAEEEDAFYSNSYGYDTTSIIYKIQTHNDRLYKCVVPFKVNDLLPINDSNILVAGYHEPTEVGVLARLNFKTKQTTTVFTDVERVYSIQWRKESNEYWIGTKEGLIVTDLSFKEKVRFDRFQVTENKLMQYDYIRMTANYGRYVIAGTIGGGVYIIDPTTYTIVKQLSLSNNLSDDKAIAIIPDDSGNCWIATWNGLNVIDSSLNITHTFFEQHGLNHKEFNTKSVTKDSKGNLYFGTLNGLLKIDPNLFLKQGTTRGLYFNKFEIRKSNISEIKDDLVSYDDLDSMVINYNAPDYYKYPFGKNYPDVDISSDMANIHVTNNTISIKGIGPGNYQLSVGGGSFNSNAEITIFRSFKNLLRLLGLFGTTILISYLIIKRNKKTEEEKTKVNKRINQLQLSALQAQMNPHFMFNALGAIQYFIQTHDIDKADEYLSDFAMLMRRILESSKSMYISLAEEVKLLELYIGLEQIRYENAFKFDFEISKEVDTESIIPPMILQPLIENAINHGLVHLKDTYGKLKIRFYMDDNQRLCCEVVDNGIGRVQASKLKKSKMHKSRGMSIIKERIETLNNTKDVVLELEIQDLYHNNGQPRGTSSILKIKEN